MEGEVKEETERKLEVGSVREEADVWGLKEIKDLIRIEVVRKKFRLKIWKEDG